MSMKKDQNDFQRFFEERNLDCPSILIDHGTERKRTGRGA
jgi:hypothetical protein